MVPSGHASRKRPVPRAPDRTAPGNGPKKPELIIHCKYANELPKPPVPKLLRVLPSVANLCRYRPSSLELDHRPFMLTERELLTRIEIVDPDAYGEAPAPGSMPPPPPPLDSQLLRDDDVDPAIKEAEAKRRRLTEKSEAWHRQAFGLQLPQLITNDVFTERQRFTTGLEAAEKKLHRDAPGFKSAGDLASKIDATFEAAKQPPVHPSKPSMKPKRIMSIVPDAVLWANRYRQIVFDEFPKEPEKNDLLFRSQPTPRITCFGFFSPAVEGDNTSYKLEENYIWENRGGFTKSHDVGDGETVLLSLPKGEAGGEIRFTTVPTAMKLKKQAAHRLDIGLDIKSLNVTHRDPSAQEASEEQERMNVVLTDEIVRDRSEASLDYVDGEWQIRGDPRTESSRSRADVQSIGSSRR